MGKDAFQGRGGRGNGIAVQKIETNRDQVGSIESPLSKRLELCQQDPRSSL